MSDHDESRDDIAWQEDEEQSLIDQLSLLEGVDSHLTAEHIASRFRDLLEEAGDDGPPPAAAQQHPVGPCDHEGVAGQPATGQRMSDDPRSVDAIAWMETAIMAARGAAADIVADARQAAEASAAELRRAREAVAAARLEAEQIVADARAEADRALDLAVKMTRDVREMQAAVEAARGTAADIVTDARQAAEASAAELRRVQEAVAAARQEAERIVSDARAEARRTLTTAASTRKEAERIVIRAPSEEERVITAGWNLQARAASDPARYGNASWTTGSTRLSEEHAGADVILVSADGVLRAVELKSASPGHSGLDPDPGSQQILLARAFGRGQHVAGATVLAVVSGHHGQVIASAGADGMVRLWDAAWVRDPGRPQRARAGTGDKTAAARLARMRVLLDRSLPVEAPGDGMRDLLGQLRDGRALRNYIENARMRPGDPRCLVLIDDHQGIEEEDEAGLVALIRGATEDGGSGPGMGNWLSLPWRQRSVLFHGAYEPADHVSPAGHKNSVALPDE